MAAYQLADIQENSTKQKTVALWACLLLSIFIYVSLFYVFKISTTSTDLFSTSKFWFFISNTLILIISIDFGTFSSSPSSKNQYDHPHHVLDEFRDHSKNSSFDQFRRGGSIQKCIVREDQSNVGSLIIRKECTRNFTSSTFVTTTNILEQLVENDEDDAGKPIDHDVPEKPLLLEYGLKGGTTNEAFDHEKKFMIEKKDKKHIVDALIRPAEPEQNDDGNVEEENEFSTMSIEELNRRFEEFIQRSYRQIRLQAGASC